MLSNCPEMSYLARIGRPDIHWSVNKLARAITKWTRACETRLARLISYIHDTSDYRQCCHVGNTAQHCWLGSFQHSDFAGDLEDSKSTSGRILCIFGSRTFVPTSWMCKTHTSVSHSSTESEVISLDASWSLGFSDWSIALFHDPTNSGNLCDNERSRKRTNTRTKKHSNQDDLK